MKHELLQLKMAEEMGGYCLCDEPGIMIDKYYDLEPNCTLCDLLLRPNWPGDRNASYGLLHKMNAEDTRNAEIAAQKHYLFILATHPATEECLIWLLYRGWRWNECETCKGEMYIPSQPDGEPDGCPECYKNNYDGGKWEKVGAL